MELARSQLAQVFAAGATRRMTRRVFIVHSACNSTEQAPMTSDAKAVPSTVPPPSTRPPLTLSTLAQLEESRALAPASRCRICFRKFFAFLVSNVGLCVLVVAYSICGAFMFRAIESPFEVQTTKQVSELRDKTILKLWNITYYNNILYYDKWKQSVTDEIKIFQRELFRAIKDGYESQHSVGQEQWSFSGAFLFSLTVISTIGYGNISPRTDKGKVVTILYAIFGIPLMLLYLTNIGDILAKSFRYVYGGLCSCKQDTRRTRNRYLVQRNISVSTSGTPSTNLTEHMADAMEISNFELTGRIKENNRVHVPITLCLFILTSYVCGGGALFSLWEDWNYLDGSYFCFITLSTIGFGDLVPGASVVGNTSSQEKLVICSLYLLAGMALLAMCFNLMQEEVIHKIRLLGKRIGIINDCEDDTFLEDIS